MKRTISAMTGKGSLTHNNRDFIADNIDKSRVSDNIIYCHDNLKQVYEELFGAALQRYNDKQKRSDRRIENYYEHIRTGKQEKLYHEVIFQMGNVKDTAVGTTEGEQAKIILDEFMKGFEQRNPHLRVFSAHLHLDEATPHLHIDFVPFTTDSKRGLDTRVSLKKALAAQGFEGGSRGDTELNQWRNSEKAALAEIMRQHGIEWEQLDTHNEHLTVLDFKKQERTAEVKALEQSLGKLKQFADQTGLCLLLVHHTRKQQADDKFDMISGTNGLLGAADGAFLLQKEKRTDRAATLELSGRDQQDQRLHLNRDMERLVWELERAET